MSETSKPISRQWAQQLRLKEEGRCIVCWQQLVLKTTYCHSCRQKKNEYARRTKGFKPYVLGKPGRPPRTFYQGTDLYLSPVELKMKNADWTMPDVEISHLMKVSVVTVKKYRKLFGGERQDSKILEVKTLKAKDIKNSWGKHLIYRTLLKSVNWRLTSQEISFRTKVPTRTVNNYRKKYAPETLPNRASRVARKTDAGIASGPGRKR
jgi:hypothetical protein